MPRTTLLWCGRGLACVPAAAIAAQAIAGKLGANPIEALLNRLGWWALVVLLASLACTPLRRVFGWSWIAPWRRIFGLAAFGYALAHLLTYAVLDKFFDAAEILEDVLRRPFITVGFAAFLLMLVLALTSPRRVVRALGGRWWRRVHQGAYAAAALGVVHFAWRVKADLREPLVFAAALAALLAARVALLVRSAGNDRQQ